MMQPGPASGPEQIGPALRALIEELRFRQAYQELATRLGLNPDPDDPRHQYDYRAAFRAGLLQPGPDQHFPSQFKQPGHPNRFVNGVDTITGVPAQGRRGIPELLMEFINRMPR